MSASTIAQVHATFFVNGPTKNVEAQTRLLEAIANEPQTAPTHGSFDERKRLPFSAHSLATYAGTRMGTPLLWRAKAPKYWGSVDASPLPIARILLHYEDIDPKKVEALCAGIARLADKLEPAYAALRFIWTDPMPTQAASMSGFSLKALHYCKYGPPGVYASTWFGPSLVHSIGLPALLAQGATATAWGGVSLQLVPEPWNATFESLCERQNEINHVLRESGFFGDYSEPVPRKGARWIALAVPSIGAV